VHSRVLRWFHHGGAAGINAMSSALTTISQSGTSFSAMGSACQQLSSAVVTLQSAGPIPYRPAERWLARSLALYSQAAADCQAGVQAESASELQQAVSDEGNATTDLNRVTAALNRSG
jgi:hypothetical protein